MKTKDEILQEEIDKLDEMACPWYQGGEYDGPDIAILSAMEAYAKQEIENPSRGIKDRGFCDYLIGYIVASDFLKDLDEIYKEYLLMIKHD